MGLKRQIETLREWACEKAKQDCYYCEYSIRDDYGSVCPFDWVLEAAEDRAKEVQKNDKKAVPREVLQKAWELIIHDKGEILCTQRHSIYASIAASNIRPKLKQSCANADMPK